MKITFLLSSLWLSGGVKAVIEFSNRLQLRGHSTTLVFPGGTLDPSLVNDIHPDITRIETPVKRTPSMNLWQLLRLTWSMARETPPSDIIIPTHTPTTPAGFIASQLFKKGATIWFCQDYAEMFSGKPIETWLLRNALRWQKGAIVVSDSLRQELLSYVEGKEIIVSREGLSHEEILHPLLEQKQEYQRTSQKTILYLGDLRPRKGLADFLSAAEKVYEKDAAIQVIIVSKSNVQVNTKIPTRSIFRPTDEALASLYQTCDVFVSSSWREGFSLPPLEAMACGAPVVMTDAGGNREYAINSSNCILVPPKNPDALANAILEVMHDQDLSNKLRTNGPLTASKFTWDEAVSRFEQALMTLS